MKRLIAAATIAEIQPLLRHFNRTEASGFMILNDSYDLIITGIGMLQTGIALTEMLKHTMYDRLVQVGVAGSYHREMELGTVTEVVTEQYGDLGAETAEKRFLLPEEMGLSMPSWFNEGIITIPPFFNNLPAVNGITVQTVAGSEHTIAERKKRYNPDVETMEGLAAFLAAKKTHTHVTQIRSLSNYVEPRNKQNWEMKTAIENLNTWLIEFIADNQ